jgi:ferric-dicitrate binding protein FerR (iron transport regulator)
MDQHDDIYGIIVKSFSEGLDEEEKRVLESWKSASTDNLMEYADYEYIWKESGKLKATGNFNLPGALAKTRRKARIASGGYGFSWLQVAAVILLSIVFSSIFYVFSPQKNVPSMAPAIVYQEVKATFGTQTRLELEDGTVAFLNSGSSLKFPVSFSGLENRKVQLSGEGYFDVAGNRDYPFVVDAGKIQVEVTGTRFNVEAYEGSSHITVALVEGEIKLVRETAGGLNELATMKPGEVASLKLAENRLYLGEHETLDKFYAWTEGKIVFLDDPIQVVVEKLSNWYNVDIEITDPRLERYRFTGTFIEEPVEQILAILSRTSPMGYSITPSRKLEDNSFTRRKIMLKSK